MAPRHFAFAVFMTLIWGIGFVVHKIGVTEVPPLLFTVLRFLVAGGLLLPFLKPVRGQMGRVAVIALTSGAFQFLLLFYAISITENVGAFAVATQMNVPMMVLLAVIFLGERIGIYRIAGLVTAFVGVMLIGFDPLAFREPVALGLILVADLSYAIAVILMRGMKGISPLQLQSWVAIISLPVLLTATLVVEGHPLTEIQTISWAGIGAVLFSAIGATMIGHGGAFFLLQRYPVAHVVPFMIVAPVLGVFFGIWLNSDPVTWKTAIGGLMTIGGVGIIQLREAYLARRQRTIKTESLEESS